MRSRIEEAQVQAQAILTIVVGYAKSLWERMGWGKSTQSTDNRSESSAKTQTTKADETPLPAKEPPVPEKKASIMKPVERGKLNEGELDPLNDIECYIKEEQSPQSVRATQSKVMSDYDKGQRKGAVESKTQTQDDVVVKEQEMTHYKNP